MKIAIVRRGHITLLDGANRFCALLVAVARKDKGAGRSC